LIVGGRDQPTIEANRAAYARLVSARDKALHLVTHATHFFEEPGALEEVARQSTDWFAQHLTNGAH
jgi:hypothetical protein